MKLTIGRLVRYVLAESDLSDHHKQFAGALIPALVVRVDDEGNAVLSGFPDFKRYGLLPVIALPDRKEAWPPQPGTWHWPPEFIAKEQQRKQAQLAKKEHLKAKAKAAAVSEA